MKKLLLVLLLSAAAVSVSANHTKGGWLYYEYLGPGSAPNTARYRVILKIYTECFLNTNQWCENLNITIFNAANNSVFETVNVSYQDSVNIRNCTQQVCHPCISFIPNICYKIATYSFTRDLPITSFGYILAYQRCCRIANIINLVPGSSSVGDTWTVNIPGTANADPVAYQNSSAKFSQNDTAIICKENYFTFDFSATDRDNDSLVYIFSDAYYSPQSNNGAQCNSESDNPPFTSVTYISPYSGSQPLGAGVSLDPFTGIVSGIAPAAEGTYVLTCTVLEYKRGTSILRSSVRKSLHISVTDCSLTRAVLDPEYFSCDGYTKDFKNSAPGGNIKTYFWDFGVPGRTDDTSSAERPVFTYPDTGTYPLKLVVNRNLPCSDSTLSVVKVYPVFATGFDVEGQCKNTPIKFLDRTTTTYGIIDSWHWNFNDPNAVESLSLIRNPVHVFEKEGTYRVRLIASNSKGCRDTTTVPVEVSDKPMIRISNDTLICVIDTLQITAGGPGTVTWSPNYNISSTIATSPLVSPDVPTMYSVALTDPYGCVGSDSVFVDVRSFVTLRAGNDTTLCQGDEVLLTVSSDALYYQWTANPLASSIANEAAMQPRVAPLVTTSYRVTGSIGKCQASDDIRINVVPYPAAVAASDTTVCFGTSAQLYASGGSSYSWTPSAYLSATNIAAPQVLNPLTTTTYIVTVRDTVGCPKPVYDTVVINVSRIFADAGPRDTVVVLDQPLQLLATGGQNYQWTPAQWLSADNSASPLALPQDDIVYRVLVSDEAGCFGTDSIRVQVYLLTAGFYVPSAFSPNNDGRNDHFRPIAVGMRTVDVFRVYNRWGVLMYNDTNSESAGWDGSYGGNAQDPGTYVWYAEGTDFRNEKVKKRGTVVLIR